MRPAALKRQVARTDAFHVETVRAMIRRRSGAVEFVAPRRTAELTRRCNGASAARKTRHALKHRRVRSDHIRDAVGPLLGENSATALPFEGSHPRGSSPAVARTK